MTTRTLPREEWPRLIGTELEEAHAVLPAGSEVIVVEDGPEILACWAIVPYTHVEGLWVRRSQRHSGRAGLRLWKAMQAALAARQTTVVWTTALTDEIADLVTHAHGVELPGRHFVMPMGGVQ